MCTARHAPRVRTRPPPAVCHAARPASCALCAARGLHAVRCALPALRCTLCAMRRPLHRMGQGIVLVQLGVQVLVQPEVRVPVWLAVRVPLQPRVQVPIRPEVRVPVQPRVQVPAPPEVGVPVQPRVQVPVPPEVGVPVQPRVQVPVASGNQDPNPWGSRSWCSWRSGSPYSQGSRSLCLRRSGSRYRRGSQSRCPAGTRTPTPAREQGPSTYYSLPAARDRPTPTLMHVLM